jgi:GTP-binding protein
VKGTYDILLEELKKYNPELLDKKRILAISKSDLIDEQQKKDIKKHLPKKVPHIFISSALGEGIKELKDLIWNSINNEE